MFIYTHIHIYAHIYAYVYTNTSYTYIYIYIHAYIYIYIYIYMYMYHSKIVNHNYCFNLFIRHNNTFVFQGSKINKNDVFRFFTFRHIST